MSHSVAPEKISDTYERYADMAWHEKELINQRLSWLLTAQTLLLGGWALITTSSKPLLMAELLVPMSGISLSLIAWFSVRAATSAHTYWQKCIDKIVPTDRCIEFPLACRQGRDRLLTAGRANRCAQCVPLVFLVVWFILLLVPFA
ncbi:MAG: hypothetical protein IT435_00560 [Phycisphaerales bacterium]|nr:hypothetical protein [Phycisphaerales bacterium]